MIRVAVSLVSGTARNWGVEVMVLSMCLRAGAEHACGLVYRGASYRTPPLTTAPLMVLRLRVLHKAEVMRSAEAGFICCGFLPVSWDEENGESGRLCRNDSTEWDDELKPIWIRNHRTLATCVSCCLQAIATHVCCSAAFKMSLVACCLLPVGRLLLSCAAEAELSIDSSR